MKKIIVALCCVISLFTYVFTQNNPESKGKKCAVVLTYDDAFDQHLGNVALVLDSLGL